MSIYNLTSSRATEWKPISDDTILDLVTKGQLSTHRLKEYIDAGRVSADKVLKSIDFSRPLEGGRTLKKYYAVLFLGTAG